MQQYNAPVGTSFLDLGEHFLHNNSAGSEFVLHGQAMGGFGPEMCVEYFVNRDGEIAQVTASYVLSHGPRFGVVQPWLGAKVLLLAGQEAEIDLVITAETGRKSAFQLVPDTVLYDASPNNLDSLDQQVLHRLVEGSLRFRELGERRSFATWYESLVRSLTENRCVVDFTTIAAGSQGEVDLRVQSRVQDIHSSWEHSVQIGDALRPVEYGLNIYATRIFESTFERSLGDRTWYFRPDVEEDVSEKADWRQSLGPSFKPPKSDFHLPKDDRRWGGNPDAWKS